jgi:LysM repeat protein
MDRAGGYGNHLQDPSYRFPYPFFLILALLIGGLFLVSMVRAEELRCGEFYTVAPGDTLNLIATECGTSVPALLAANPEVTEGDLLLPGQILRIPINDAIPDTGSLALANEAIPGTGAPNRTYTVVAGDTLSGIASRSGTTVNLLLQANPQIVDRDLIFPGQVLVIPGTGVVIPPEPVIPDTGQGEQTYIVRAGDTLSAIASRYGITTSALVQRNPQITNPDLIFPGQQIVIPGALPPPVSDPIVIPDTGAGELLYTILRGDTLSEIAFRYGIPTSTLIQRNTHIANPDLIFPGQQIVIPGALPAPTPLPSTPQPTPTIFPNPTPTPTITPTEPVTDVIPDTGEIIYQDDFSVPDIWFTAIHANFRMEYAEGGYRILNNTSNSFVSSVLNMDLTDILVETRAEQVGGPLTGYYGVACRWQDIFNLYAFVIGSDGFYGIARVQDGQLTFLGEGRTTGGPILLGQTTNRIWGSCVGDTLTLFVNGQFLLQVQDTTFSTGKPGLVVATRDVSGTHVHFDDFALRR